MSLADEKRERLRSRWHKPGRTRRHLRGRGAGLGRAVSIVLLLFLLAVRIWDPDPVEALRLRVFDAFQVLKPRKALPERPVMIVDLDEDSMQEFGQWPWPRTRVAELITALTGMGAAVIGLDVVFAEPDRLSPDLVAASLPNLTDSTRAELRSHPSNDEVLAGAIRNSRVVLGQTATSQPVPWKGQEAPPQTGIAVIGVDPDPSQALMSFPGLLRNVAVLERAAAGRGVFTISPERDGIVRRVPMIISAGGAT